LFFIGIILYRMVTTAYQISFADLILIALLILFSSGILDNLIEISFSSEKGFSARFRRVEGDLMIINEIAKHVLTEGERLQLNRLKEENIVMVKYSYFLLGEMIRLCQHNFVNENFSASTWRMKDLYEKPESSSYNLKDYYHITEDGKEYLKLLEELNKRQREKSK